MLVDGDKTGKNFLNADIFHYANTKVYLKHNRIPEITIDEYRLYNNMLSSMPMCFNLFYPLRQALEKKEPFIDTLFSNIFQDMSVCKVTGIDIEYIPLPINEYIDDKTAFDAVIWFEDSIGQKGIIGIEVKYTDKLGNNKASRNVRKLKVAEESGIFTPKAIEGIRNNGCTQIMRNILLTEAYRLHNKLTYSWSVILSPEDEPYSNNEIDNFRKLLMPDYHNKLKRVYLENFTDHCINGASDKYKQIFKDFKERYLAFDKVIGLLT
jgi:hypothetical protein